MRVHENARKIECNWQRVWYPALPTPGQPTGSVQRMVSSLWSWTLCATHKWFLWMFGASSIVSLVSHWHMDFQMNNSLLCQQTLCCRTNICQGLFDCNSQLRLFPRFIVHCIWFCGKYTDVLWQKSKEYLSLYETGCHVLRSEIYFSVRPPVWSVKFERTRSYNRKHNIFYLQNWKMWKKKTCLTVHERTRQLVKNRDQPLAS